MGTQLPSPKWGIAAPTFRPIMYCGQRARWIKMSLSLGMDVGFGPGHIVLDGEPAPPPKGAEPRPQF